MKTVLITGTSKGLGLELLKVFLANGWQVLALARNISSFTHITNKYPKLCHPIEGDITDDLIIEKIYVTIKSNSDKIDVLINNAGNAVKCFDIENVTPKELDDHFKVHVSGAFRVIKESLPFLQKSDNPLIINISSRKGSINKIASGGAVSVFKLPGCIA
ncbi:SDR family NAD(P)-dependent oxidoreductase [Bacteroidota bacterium]